MKFNKLYIVLLFAMTALFVGCSDFEDTVEPSPLTPEGCQGVYFPTSNKALFELEPADARELTLTIARKMESGTAEVPLKVEINTDDIFDVPATVSFADGETEVEFKVTFPDAGEGTAYNLKVAVEGDQFVDPYASTTPYVVTSASRVKWEVLADPWIYVDGVFTAGYKVSSLPMYVDVEKAQLSDAVRYRFKNAYDVPTGGPDADGIYDGYPNNEEGHFDESKDYYTVIEIDNPSGKSGNAVMPRHEIGVNWGYGDISIGSVPDKYGVVTADAITFGDGALYISESEYNDGAAYAASVPTVIYTNKEAFIKANLKITDFNDVDYKTIEGEVSEYWSAAISKDWAQTIAKAIDADPENDESDYKNLYYLADLYANGKGLAFYYEEGGKVKIPADQATGLEVFGQEVYVSQSADVESSVEVNGQGYTVYTLGMLFHYEDGTKVGEFAEKFYYGKTKYTFEISDFIGHFVLSGPSVFDKPDAAMAIEIAEGTEANTLIITGMQYAEEVVATYNPATSTMSIAPQALADYGIYDIALYTFNSVEEVPSGVATIDLSFSVQNTITVSHTSEMDGYLLYSKAVGGWVSGYYDIVLTPTEAPAEASVAYGFDSMKAYPQISPLKNAADAGFNFKVESKIDSRPVKQNATPIVF
ncbi:hypothetical protein [Carboxylicivirga sp. RSCT41]|uniref:hypothetical protein n=1 Tax=Carboxylicivirga agarovorans TaxID=3417570 RepID=UPI003D3473DC